MPTASATVSKNGREPKSVTLAPCVLNQAQRSAWPYPQKGPQEFIGHALDVVAPLEDRLVLRQVPLAHPAEPTQEVPHPRPDPLLRVAVDLAHPVPVVVPRPGGLRPRVVHRLVTPLHPGKAVFPLPLVGVDHRPLQRRTPD